MIKKSLISIILLTCAAILPSLHLSAASVVMTVAKFPLQNIDDYENNPFGSRVPARPLSVIIDFDSEEIILPPGIDDIEYYEIRNENQSAILFTSEDPKEFVRTLAMFTSTVSVILTTGSYILTGYLDL